jgi:hypothetical protein
LFLTLSKADVSVRMLKRGSTGTLGDTPHRIVGWSGKREAKEAGTQAELKAGDRFFAFLNTLLMRFSGGYSL